jgi:hypothetical protein
MFHMYCKPILYRYHRYSRLPYQLTFPSLHHHYQIFHLRPRRKAHKGTPGPAVGTPAEEVLDKRRKNIKIKKNIKLLLHPFGTN